MPTPSTATKTTGGPFGGSFRPNHALVPTRAPWNIRITARLRRLPLLRASAAWHRCCDRLASSRLLPHRGAFTYRRLGREHQIPFDARNAQFEAVHDPLYHHGYELETALLLSRLNAGPGCFLDVGANWGYFALLVAATPGFAGRVHAFEPNPGSRADLTAAVAAAELDDIVTCHGLALGDTDGTANFSGGGDFRTGLAGLSETGPGLTVRVRRLDELGLPPPTCLKLDVEGSEAAVLRGAAQVLATARPYVVIENFLNRDAHQETLEPLRLLEAAGYRLFVPALAMRWQESDLLTAYWTHLPPLLAAQPAPPVRLMQLRAAERFLYGHHLNLFACAAERVAGLSSIPGLQVGSAT
jgi:FkbM family methyltransferase